MATAVSEPLGRGDTPKAPGSRSALAEFLLVGGLTPFLYPLSWLARRAFGLDASEYAIGFFTFHAAHVINDPHFSVTYLLFYEGFRERAFGAAFPPSLRARYLAVGVLAPLVLLVWAGYGAVTRSAPALGALVQTMFLLVGWHYVKQGFGVLAVLSSRRGVTYTGDERLVLLLHGYAGWAYAWASPADPGTLLEEKGVVFTSWARSAALERATFSVFVASFAAVVVMLGLRARRERRLPHPAPLFAYLSSIWAWSVYSGIDPLVRYVVPALHSIQYLAMVRLLRENEAREHEGPPRFERSARVRLGLLALSALGLGLVLFHGVGQALDAVLVRKGEALLDSGPTPYFAAVYVVVNLHHYLMDTVLWRRENPKTRYLRGPV